MVLSILHKIMNCSQAAELAFAFTYEPRHEQTGLWGFRPGLTQTNLYSHRSRLEALNFGFKKKRDCTIHVAKTKLLISFAVTAKLICAFVFSRYGSYIESFLD